MVNQWKRGWDIHEVNRGYNRYVYVKGGKANAINIAFFGMIVTDSYFVTTKMVIGRHPTKDGPNSVG
jgi:hypothetical protein